MLTPLAKALSDEYDIGTIADISRIEAGYLTENNLVKTDNQNFFLKCHRAEVAGNIAFVEAVEEFFSNGGIPVILPIRTRNNVPHFAHEGKTYSVYPFVKGLQYKRADLAAAHIKSLAATLAQMHLLSKNGIPDAMHQKSKEDWNKEKVLASIAEIETKMAAGQADDAFAAVAREALVIKKKFISKNTISYADLSLTDDALTHGDYQEQNAFFDEHGNILYLFDFEKAKVCPRNSELVRSIMLMCFDGLFEDLNFEKARAYLAAYNKLYSIDKTALASALNAHVIKSFHSTWVEGEHYLKQNTRVDEFLSRSLPMLKYMNDYSREFQARILSLL